MSAGNDDRRLRKDCQCVTHDGPHWLHMSRIDRDRNRRDFETARETGNWLLMNHVAGEEARRLGELLKDLRSAGFADTDSLPPEVRETVRLLAVPVSAQGAA